MDLSGQTLELTRSTCNLLNPGQALFALLCFDSQILTQYADIVSVEFPKPFARFLTYVDIVNFDVGWFTTAACVVNVDFYGRLLITTLGPLALLSALGVTYLIAR